jgi:hypothetical protein
MGAIIMKTPFHLLQYAQAELLLAEKKNDAAEIERWRQLVAYWQNVYQAEKQGNLMA